MVSKLTKRTPTKCIKDCRGRRHHRKRSPVRKAAAPPSTSSRVLASINKSLSSCHRRLVKVFSKLARISTPGGGRRKGYKVLKKAPKEEPPLTDTVRRTLVFDDSHRHRLPPLKSPNKKTVFLDLDETLVHSKADPPPKNFDFVVRPVIDGEAMNFYVLKRPGVHEFLEALAKRYEIVVFTAGMREYASLVVDRIDRTGAISHRLYRDSCREMDGKFVKDLSGLGRDLNRVAIVDDNPNSYMLQPENAIPVRPFIDDAGDMELGKLLKFFEHSVCFDNMRDAVKLHLAELEISNQL